MKKSLQTVFLLLIALTAYSQSEWCATMDVYNEMITKDPSLKIQMEEMQKQNQKYVEQKIKRQIEIDNTNYIKKIPPVLPYSLCGYNNTYANIGAAPSTLNGTVTITNFTGGYYVRLTGMVAGNTYQISTCGQNTFDPQITIYTAGGGTAVAHNDDFCANGQSEIWFTPMTSGSYDILLDEYPCYCLSCQSLDMKITLVDVPNPIITIPVVVHVFHYGEAIGMGRNISDAQIQTQIAWLNEDFRRKNTDISNVPAAFRGWSADPLIEFCLATRDPNGNQTTGITRHLGTQPDYDKVYCESTIKPSTVWNRDKYLNLWTVEFSSSTNGLLGYAQFPSGPANTDGVVIKYAAFGNGGMPSYDWGRVAVHEIGHWLNLNHIWGDDGTACTGTDNVFDTPNQAGENYGCPSFPLSDACTSLYPSAMFMNYMDYTDDACKNMFTYGQRLRMEATLAGPRSSLKTSNGCSSAGGIEEYLAMSNISVFPNPSNGIFTITQKENIDKYSITIINVYGENVYEGKISGASAIINLQDKAAGLYFIRMEGENKIITKKILIEK